MKPKLTITASNRDRLKVGSPSTELFIKSIQWQTFKDFELLIVDGGSDNYKEIKHYFDTIQSTIQMRIVQCKIGEAFERAKLNNVGIRNALGEYVMTTDVDMAYGKDFVKTLMGLVNPKVMVESRTMYWKKPLVQKIYNGEIDLYTDINSCKKGRIKKRTTAGGCQAMHIDNWNKVRGFSEKFIGWGSEDYDLLTRVQMAGLTIKWMGESKESIELFHQPHIRDTRSDLEYQHKNKKLLNKIKSYRANPDGWGTIKM